MPTDYSHVFESEVWQRNGSTEDDMAAPAESYADSGDPSLSAVSAPPSHLFTPAAPDTSELHAGHMVGALFVIAEEFRGWRQFREVATGTISGGSVILTRPPVRPGWEWRVRRVTISVSGASAAATAAIYVGPEFGETAAPDESYLTDFAGSMLGNSPSRVTATPVNAYYLAEGDALAIVIAGAAGAGLAFARIEGVRRQV